MQNPKKRRATERLRAKFWRSLSKLLIQDCATHNVGIVAEFCIPQLKYQHRLSQPQHAQWHIDQKKREIERQ